ncbi:MAG: tetratricopeptide repeat protein, partial [Desulfocapsaceae bacterium]|nr:tetratricopeptide repeat protein [Desulfocapsaceae bacterium]
MNKRGHGLLWHSVCNFGLLIVVTLFLHGCAVKHPVDRPVGPASVFRPRPTPAPYPAPAPVPAPSPPPNRESVPVAEEGKAAGTLLASARQSVRSGQFSQAEMMLERALRLEPRNARLWHEMAQVKYGQN